MDRRGKIKLLVTVSVFVVTGMFLFLSALDDPNIKEYDSVNQKVTIKSSSGETISDVILNTPLNFIVPRGYQKVAEFTIDNKQSSKTTSSVLEKLKFYDIGNGNQEIVRQFDYKYEKSLGLKTINDYEVVCSYNDLGNGTVLQDCSQILIGTHQEEMFEWADLNSLEEIPTGKTKIGIFTNVEKGDKIEWVPTFLGVEVTEWATWTEALNTGLVSYYKLDNNDLTDSLFALNGTNDGSTNITGKVNSARYFGGTNSVDFASSAFTSSIAYSFWFMTNSTTCTGDGCSIYYKGTADSTVSEYINILGDEIHFVFGATGGQNNIFDTTAANINISEWNHLVINGTGNGATGAYQIFVNNITQSTSFSGAGGGGARPTGSYASAIGDDVAVLFTGLTGRIDEFGIWNRTLTSSEVSDLYNNGSGLPYGVIPQNYTITFNLTDSATGVQISTSGPKSFDMSCNNGFNASSVENPYTAVNFGSGIVGCTFSGLSEYFIKNQTITADSNKTVEVPMSSSLGLTLEEHDWLEAIYLCVVNGTGCA